MHSQQHLLEPISFLYSTSSKLDKGNVQRNNLTQICSFAVICHITGSLCLQPESRGNTNDRYQWNCTFSHDEHIKCPAQNFAHPRPGANWGQLGALSTDGRARPFPASSLPPRLHPYPVQITTNLALVELCLRCDKLLMCHHSALWVPERLIASFSRGSYVIVSSMLHC